MKSIPLADIAREIGKSKPPVSNALKKLKEKGKVISYEYGLWTVPREAAAPEVERFQAILPF